MIKQHDRIKSLSKQTFGLIIGLCVEFILGMTTNIYVSFPENLSEKQNWEFAQNQIPLVLHMIIGALLLIGSIALLIQAIRTKIKSWIIIASLGMVAMLITFGSGSAFVGSQVDVYSFVMAIGFILTLFIYIWGIYKLKL